MSPPPGFHPDLLLAHAGALRNLARGLLRDPHAAEDAVQETWVRALEHPPQTLDRLGAWLRTVLRSVVHKRLRGESRRVERERHRARADRVESDEVVLEHRQTLRRMVTAVLALREPYHTAIMLRYFEGLPPRAIAERLGVPVTTVNSRLQRGLRMLREHLDEESPRRTWAPALAALTGLTPERAALVSLGSLSASGLLRGLVVMGMKTKIAAAAAVVLVAGFALWPDEPPLADPFIPNLVRSAGAAAPSVPASAVAANTAPVAGGELSAERTAIAEDPLLTPVVADLGSVAPYEYHLQVLVRDEDDRPVRDADVCVCPIGGPWNDAGRTNEHGILHLRWRGLAPAMSLGVGARAAGTAGEPWRRIELRSGVTHHATLGVRSQYQNLVLGEDAVATLRLDSEMGERMGFIINTSFLSPSAVPLAPEMAELENGWRGFVAPVQGAQTFDTFELPSGSYSLQLSGDIVSLRASSVSLLRFGGRPTAETEPPPPDAARVAGVVLGANGEPATDTLILAGMEHGPYTLEARTNANGEFVLDGLPPGAWRLRAGGGSRGLATAHFAGGPGQEVNWEASLDRGQEILGRIVDPDGSRQLNGWLVCAVSEDPDYPWFDSCTTDPKGRFSIPNLPSRPLRLMLHGPGAWDRPPFLVEEAVLPGRGPVELAIADVDLPRGSIAVGVTDEGGEPVPGLTVRLWHEESGRGFDLSGGGDDPRLAADDLPGGNYTMTVGAPGREWIETQRFHLAPGEDVDLGALVHPAPGTLRLEALGGPPADGTTDVLTEGVAASTIARVAGRIHRLDPTVITHVADVDALSPFELDLPAGRYELVTSTKEGSHALVFEITSGAVTRLTVAAAITPEIVSAVTFEAATDDD